MLKIENLEAGYGKVKVLHGISLDVPAGKVVTLIGSNGAGKTTTMRAVSGMLRPSAGTITLGPGSTEFDDVCLFPFAMPTSWASALYTWHNANAWPNLPALKVQGDAIPDAAGYRLCKGVVKGANLMRGALGGTKYSNLTQLSVGLLEV